jgi:SAM-dependent methyltransferase
MELFRLAAEQLCRPASDLLTREFDHYRAIVASAYSGLSPQEACDLAYYNNLETKDPVGRCPYYRGTDQRDFFIPRLKELFKQLPTNARIGDFGAGDGQTTAMALDALPGKAVIDIVEPSQAIEKYKTHIAATKNLSLGTAIQAGFEGFNNLLPDNSLDMALCIHAIYFFDIAAGVQSMYRSLKPGASLFVEFADETRSTTGRAITGYFNRIGRPDVAEEHQMVFNERVQLLSSNPFGRNMVSIIGKSFGHTPLLTVEEAPSRFYGDKFGDMAGFGLVSGLPFFEPKNQALERNLFNIDKVLSVLKDIKDSPQDFDLAIVNDPANPRHGMWTTTQPQKIVTITKPPGIGMI